MQDQSSKLIIFFIIFFVVVGVVSTAAITYISSGPKPRPTAAPKKPGVITTNSKKTDTQKSQFANTSGIAGDVNDDGSVTAADIDMINGEMGCAEGQECWTKVIGKTLSGDNPIYVMDMDYSKDGSINEADIPSQ